MRLLALAFALMTSAASAASLDGLPVTVTNGSEPVLCAEKDNISVNFTSREVKHFRIEAQHPNYIGALTVDRNQPDWTACEMKTEALSNPMPTKETLFESEDFTLYGFREKNFWRKADTTIQIGGKTFRDIHMVQLWGKYDGRREEFLVIYPMDGYWRARPFAPKHLTFTAYGSSFLIGPVTIEGRPIVKLKDISFDLGKKAITVTFDSGNKAVVSIAKADQDAVALDVDFDKPITKGAFATMRSMYVTEFNNDVARIALRRPGAQSWDESTIMGFKTTRATDIWAGRLVPSKHNTSAPDMMFNDFRKEKAKK